MVADSQLLVEVADSQLLVEVADSQLLVEVAESQLRLRVAGITEAVDWGLVEVAGIQRQAEELRHIAVSRRSPFCVRIS